MQQPYFTVEMRENTDLNPGQVSTASSSSRALQLIVNVKPVVIKREYLGPASRNGLA